jgi:hypothetical protein
LEQDRCSFQMRIKLCDYVHYTFFKKINCFQFCLLILNYLFLCSFQSLKRDIENKVHSLAQDPSNSLICDWNNYLDRH